jgi:LacI family transcriptional regulator
MAGVSQSTVSRALAGDKRITDTTKALVERAARDAGYVPHALGRSLARRSTASIGIVIGDLANPYYPYLLSPITEAIEAAGYRPILFLAQSDEKAVFMGMANGSIDGAVITTSSVTSELPLMLADRHVPVVLINRDVDGLEIDRCLVDNVGGGLSLAHELVALGHREIALIMGPREYSTSRDRERGFAEGLAESGITMNEDLVWRGAFTYESGYEGMQRLFDSGRSFSAVFCANDVIALGAYNAALARHVSVPGNLTLVGFDDIPLASWDAFQLTTMRYDAVQMGQIGVRLVLERIASPDLAARSVRLVPQLTLRHTHGPPRDWPAPWADQAGPGHVLR